MEYIFGQNNCVLQTYTDEWLNHEKTGMYYIEGDAQVGKTTYLKAFSEQAEQHGKSVLLMTGERVSDIVINNIRKHGMQLSIDTDVLLIDDVPGLETERSFRITLIDMLRKSMEGRLVIMTQHDGRVHFDEAYNRIPLIPVYPIEVNPENVRKVADSKGYSFSDEQIEDFCDNGSIPEVITAMNDSVGLGKLFKEINGWF